MGVIRDIDRSCRGLGNCCLLYFTDKKKIPRRTQHVHPIKVNKEAEIGSVEVSLTTLSLLESLCWALSRGSGNYEEERERGRQSA